jgi:hypothetical protein
MSVFKKCDFDAQVAAELGVSKRTIREVTTSFLSKIVDALTDLDEAHLDGFGRLTLIEAKHSQKHVPILVARPTKGRKANVAKARYRVTRTFRVHFKKSETFNRILREKHGPSGVREK